jgi:hypothetical protein
MKLRIHHHDDPLERLKVVPFLRMQNESIEEWNHFHCEIESISDDENVCPIVPAATVISLDVPAVQSISNRFENVPAGNILAHVEFRDACHPIRTSGFRWKATWKLPSPSTNPAM